MTAVRSEFDQDDVFKSNLYDLCLSLLSFILYPILLPIFPPIESFLRHLFSFCLVSAPLLLLLAQQKSKNPLVHSRFPVAFPFFLDLAGGDFLTLFFLLFSVFFQLLFAHAVGSSGTRVKWFLFALLSLSPSSIVLFLCRVTVTLFATTNS